MIATELNKKSESIQIAVLNIPEDNRKLIQSLTGHFEPKTYVIYERYVFNMTHETADDYLRRLREIFRS